LGSIGRKNIAKCTAQGVGIMVRGQVTEFENMYAKIMGAKRCVATASGTTSLITAQYVAGVDAGDEVLVIHTSLPHSSVSSIRHFPFC
jgi:dTDP-4-amino-4,6-dideoxygalactose transaminase